MCHCSTQPVVVSMSAMIQLSGVYSLSIISCSLPTDAIYLNSVGSLGLLDMTKSSSWKFSRNCRFLAHFVTAVALKNISVKPWKESDDMWIRLDTIPECDRQTDRRTDL